MSDHRAVSPHSATSPHSASSMAAKNIDPSTARPRTEADTAARLQCFGPVRAKRQKDCLALVIGPHSAPLEPERAIEDMVAHKLFVKDSHPVHDVVYRVHDLYHESLRRRQECLDQDLIV